MLFARSKDKLESVAEAVRKDISGAKVSCFATDVQDYEAVQSSVEQAVKERGQIDVLINNVRRCTFLASQHTTAWQQLI